MTLAATHSQENTVVAAMNSQQSLAYEKSMADEILQSQWAFPHLTHYISNPPDSEFIDPDDAYRMLGCIANFFGVE